MNISRLTSLRLHEEHQANLDLLARIEQALVRMPHGGSGGPELTKLVGTLGQHLAHEVRRHFEFEERELFPRMNGGDDGDLAALLLEEHEAIRAVSAEVLPLTRAATAGTLDAAGWGTLKRSTLELVERLTAHIQKEELALLPAVDDLLDEATDRDLVLAYTAL